MELSEALFVKYGGKIATDSSVKNDYRQPHKNALLPYGQEDEKIVALTTEFDVQQKALAAMVGNGIRIKDVSVRNLGIIPEAFRRLGVQIDVEGDDLIIPHQEHYVIDSFIDGTIMTLADAPWPGLTPDLLSVLIVVATQAKGSVLFHQKMFESRLFFVDKLIDMGAQIILCDPHRAVVVGHDHQIRLRGGRMASPDIRAGIALLIAALSANGISRIANIEQIDRGYEDIENRLIALGAHIKRENNPTNETL